MVIIKIKYLVKNFEQDPDLDLVNNCISKCLNNVTNANIYIYMQKYVMTIYRRKLEKIGTRILMKNICIDILKSGNRKKDKCNN